MRIVVFGLLLWTVCAYAIPAAAQQWPGMPWAEEGVRIQGMFHRGEYDAVLTAVDRFYEKYPLDDVNWPYLVFRGESQHRRGDFDAAFRTLLDTLPYIRRIEKIEQARTWARVYFIVGALHGRRGEFVEAIAAIEDGLRLTPDNTMQWFALGDMFAAAGDRPRALAFYGALRDLLPARGELRAVVALKLDRLGNAPGVSRGADVPDTVFPGLRVRLLPVGPQDGRVVLADLCLLVQSKWLVSCDVLAPVAMPEPLSHEKDRRQRDADRLVAELGARRPPGVQPGDAIVAIVSDDIYASSVTAYTHTFALHEPASGMAIVSTSRLLAGLEEAYEPRVVAMRRVGIQILSSVGALLGVTRATSTECPTTYAPGLAEFQMKDARLCAAEIAQRDALLRRRGRVPVPVTDDVRREMTRVYEMYRFE